MKITPISSNLNCSRIDYRKDVPKQEVNTSVTLPSFADAKSLVNMSFKAKIHDCVVNGYWQGIQQELDRGVNINTPDSFGITPLLKASSMGNTDIVEKLLQHPDINVNTQDRYGNTPLIIASFHKRTDTVRKILEHPDVNINLKDSEGRTALYYAIIDPEIAKMIEDYVPGVDRREGVNRTQAVSDINEKDRDGNTALIRACGDCEDTEIVKILLRNPDIYVNAKNRTGNTALIWASCRGNADAVETLLKHPDINVNIQDNFGNTALTLASFHGLEDVTEKLLQHPDIDINLKDCDGHTALYWATQKKHTRIAKMIEDYVPGVDRRGEVNQAQAVSDINAKDKDGNTALIRACMADNKTEEIEKLLQNPDIEVNAQDNYGYTALMWAIFRLNIKAVEKLLQHPDIDVNIQDRCGNTAFGMNRNGTIQKMMKDYVRGVDRRACVNQTVNTTNLYSPEENIFSEEEITKKFLSLLKTKQLKSAEEIMEATPLINLTANDNEVLNTACTTGNFDFVTKVIDYQNTQPQRREEYDAKRKDFLENKIKTLSYEELKENPVALHTEDGFKILMEKEEFNPNDIVDKKSLFDYACKIDTKGEIAKQILSKYDDINIDNAKRNGSTEIKALAYFYENVGKYQVKFDKIKRNIANPETRSLGAEQLKEFINSSEFKPEMADSLGNSTLHIAASMADDSSRGLIDRLITKGVKLDSKNITNQNALISAIKAFRIATTEEDKTKLLSNIKFLLDKGLDVNEPDSNGQTAFHHACSTTSVALLSLVLSKEPNVFTKDKLGHKGSYYLKNQQMKDVLDNYINN